VAVRAGQVTPTAKETTYTETIEPSPAITPEQQAVLALPVLNHAYTNHAPATRHAKTVSAAQHPLAAKIIVVKATNAVPGKGTAIMTQSARAA